MKLEYNNEVAILRDGVVVAEISAGESELAYLIAAAPELLEALEDIRDSGLLNGSTVLHEKMSKQLYAAIAKAKGE